MKNRAMAWVAVAILAIGLFYATQYALVIANGWIVEMPAETTKKAEFNIGIYSTSRAEFSVGAPIMLSGGTMNSKGLEQLK